MSNSEKSTKQPARAIIYHMKNIFSAKLQPGDTVAVIAPSRSLAILSEETKSIANKRFADLGIKLVFGKHYNECNTFRSSSIDSRVSDLHAAFADPNVKAILTVIGGYNSNQLLRYLDWNLIRSNPKILCGYSDITALSNAIYAKTGLVGYSGPHYSSFGQKLHFDYTLDYFQQCLMSDAPFSITPSTNWSDDQWYADQDKRTLIPNEGWLVINQGEANGTIIGGNICTLNLLQGTEYMPPLDNTILLLEDDELAFPEEFDRNLQSLLHLPDFSGVKGIVLGRFQKASKLTPKILIAIIKSKQELKHMPVIANVDFGHTDPKITFPIGGTVTISTKPLRIQINRH